MTLVGIEDALISGLKPVTGLVVTPLDATVGIEDALISG